MAYYPNLGTGYDFSYGGGPVDLNQFIPNEEYDASNPYNLKPGQVVMNEGTPSATVVGKGAPRGWFGLPRAVTGTVDALTNTTWLPDTDWDKRGTGRDSYGNLPKPGELGAMPVAIPQMKVNPNYGQQQQAGNYPLPGSPVPNTFMNQLGHYGISTGIGGLQTQLGLNYSQQAMANAYPFLRTAMRDNTMETILRNQGLQRTDKGYSERATEQQDRMLAGAQANYLRRMGVAAMSNAAAEKAGKGIQRTYFTG